MDHQNVSHNIPASHSPEEIAKLGEQFYFSELKDKFEAVHRGEYVVIDVEQKKYIIHADLSQALQEARDKFGPKLFSIIQIGNLQQPASNYRLDHYAWKF